MIKISHPLGGSLWIHPDTYATQDYVLYKWEITEDDDAEEMPLPRRTRERRTRERRTRENCAFPNDYDGEHDHVDCLDALDEGE